MSFALGMLVGFSLSYLIFAGTTPCLGWKMAATETGLAINSAATITVTASMFGQTWEWVDVNPEAADSARQLADALGIDLGDK